MPSKPRTGIIDLHHPREKNALKIVGDGAIAHPMIGEGRLIPVVILDTTDRPDLEEHIRLHQYISPGDVTVQWGQVIGHEDTISLILSLSRPSEMIAIIEFDLERNHGVLIEQVLASKALYIQHGREGDRLKYTMEVPKVILEVLDTGFRDTWDQIHTRYVTAKLKSEGLNRATAKREAKRLIEEIRSFSAMRVP